MLLVTLLAPFVLLATYIMANPVVIRDSTTGISLAVTKRITTNGTFNAAQRDQARMAKFANQLSASSLDEPFDLPLYDEGNLYTGRVGIGSPPTFYNLIIDTGSANTWVGANKPYGETQTSVKTSDSVKVEYGSGFFNGFEYHDTVTIAPGVAIYQQSIGVASKSSGFSPFDGILGLGPIDLTFNSLSPDTNTLTPTVTNNLFHQGVIPQEIVAVSFEPLTPAFDSEPVTNGELMFGGVDTTKFIGDLTYFPLTTTSPSSLYWGVDATFGYGGSTTIMAAGSGIIDTGTSLILLAPDAFNKYVAEAGATLDKRTGFYKISTERYSKLESLFFTIDGRSFELTRNAQIMPRVYNTALGGDKNVIYLAIGNLGTINGLDFICGMAFLERFYAVFDTTNQRLGLAETSFTYADTN